MLFLQIDHTHKRSFAKQIYQQIRDKILAGELTIGEALPATRDLSLQLCVARNTILVAYDMLVAEGFARSVPRSGIYVNAGTCMKKAAEPLADYHAALLTDTIVPRTLINFDSGLPALDRFPRHRWNQTVSRAFMEAPESALGYDNPQGRPELRKVLCRYLNQSRGIICSPDQIIITSGTKQGLSLIAKCLLDENSQVFIENPTNENVKKIFGCHTKNIIPIEVDSEGIQPELFPRDQAPSLIFTTPSHQFPMGGVLSIKRRIELIEYARKTGCYIVEDDYDSEFNYDNPPPRSLYELDNQHVIYTGTFSKLLFPSLRLGYLVLPLPQENLPITDEGNCLLASVREQKRLADHHSNSIYQLALMRFIENGDLAWHIKRMKREYRKRRDCLLALLETHFGDQVKIYGESAGMHLIAEFNGIDFNKEMIHKLEQQGLYIVPVQQHSLAGNDHNHQIILGYAQLSQTQMQRGIEILKNTLCIKPPK